MSQRPAIDLSETEWNIVNAVLHKHVPDRTVWAFGSRAKWAAKAYSDLDLAVVGEQAMGLDLRSALAEDFAQSDLPYKVDVVDWATTSETFRRVIERDKVVVRGEAVHQ
jgi:predicted nucleotidyltransferase